MNLITAVNQGMHLGVKRAGKKLGLEVISAKVESCCQADDCFGCLMFYEDDSGIGRCREEDID